MTNLFDSYLLYRIRTKRDPEAFARIYDRYVDAIYRFALFKLPGKEEAQDVTAETFTRAWQYIGEHRTVTHVRALLYRIARNLIVDFFRQTRPTISLEEAVTIEGSGASHIVEGDQHARAELALVLQRLEKLKEDYRDVLTLRLIDDLPFPVISEILEKKPGHVRVLYHRVLHALKESEEQTTT